MRARCWFWLNLWESRNWFFFRFAGLFLLWCNFAGLCKERKPNKKTAERERNKIRKILLKKHLKFPYKVINLTILNWTYFECFFKLKLKIIFVFIFTSFNVHSFLSVNFYWHWPKKLKTETLQTMNIWLCSVFFDSSTSNEQKYEEIKKNWIKVIWKKIEKTENVFKRNESEHHWICYTCRSGKIQFIFTKLSLNTCL